MRIFRRSPQIGMSLKAQLSGSANPKPLLAASELWSTTIVGANTPELEFNTVASQILHRLQPHEQTDAKVMDIIQGMHATVDANAIRIMAFGLNRFLRSCFKEILVYQDNVKDIVNAFTLKDGPVVFLPCHRSHLDYLILSYVCFAYDFPIPMIAAGENLNIPVVGAWLKNCGAIFIKRSFKGEELYKAVFKEWMNVLVEHKQTVEWFPEGTRSRTGRLLPVKLGMLKLFVEAFEAGMAENIHFVPVDISYEIPFGSELDSYVDQRQGKPKVPESVAGLIQAILGSSTTKTNQMIGDCHLSFGKPFCLKDLASDLPRDSSSLLDYTAQTLQNEMQRSSRLNVTTLLASCLLHFAESKPSFTEDFKERTCSLATQVARYLSFKKHPLAFTLDNQMESQYLEIFAQDFDHLESASHLAEDKLLKLDFLRNNVSGCLTAASLLCISLRTRKTLHLDTRPESVIADSLRLHSLLRHEYPTTLTQTAFEEEIKALQTFSVLSHTMEVTDTKLFDYFCGLCFPLLQTYHVVLHYARKNSSFKASELRDFVRRNLAEDYEQFSPVAYCAVTSSAAFSRLKASSQEDIEFLHQVVEHAEDAIMSRID
jgi:1-acyl-sn-glycerol-3-phosphate acyltransferase